jgi:hypothetical protein
VVAVKFSPIKDTEKFITSENSSEYITAGVLCNIRIEEASFLELKIIKNHLPL